MKKIVITLLLISIFYIFISNLMVKSLEIPQNAIRIRIVPNSNNETDQSIKNKLKDKLEIKMYDLLKNTNNSKEARELIENNLDNIKQEVKTVFDKEHYQKEYQVNYGYNYFPEKQYKGVKYKEGYYESLLVTIGEGKGDNWWCVLFPPLCLIEAQESTDAEYKSFIKEMLDKYLK